MQSTAGKGEKLELCLVQSNSVWAMDLLIMEMTTFQEMILHGF